MCANDGETDQVRRLLAFLEPVMSLQTREERFEKYQEIRTKLNPNFKDEVWLPMHSVNFPWSGTKIEFWKTLRCEIQTKFRGVICDECTREITMRPIQPFCFIDYSTMLGGLLDKYLEGLDKYIDTQDDIDKVTADMDAYPEDMRDLLVKGMRTSRLKRAQEFMDVILFMHAVPQRVDGRWDSLDLDSDVTWFREHCEVYQKNEELMAFLRDCAVVVLITGCFDVSKDVKSIWECYRELDLYPK